MPAYKNKDNGSWYVVTQYTDWTGERKPKCKRGFATRREALEWEQKFQQQSAGDLDMSFEAFVEIYTTDLKARLKESTWQTKEHIIQTKILPYFGKRKINEITTKDVIAWQNELLAYRDEKHKPYSQSYLKTLHNQLSAIFNHAVRFYDLRSNPAAKAGNMGSEERKEMLFWTKEEYQKFAEEMMATGTVAAIRSEKGNLQYAYFYPAEDPETVLLIDSWESQAAIDEHHHTPMMQTIIALRDKYDLHMKVLRFLSDDVPEADHGFIRS